MRSWLQAAGAMGIAISILGAAHYYLWARLVRDMAWPAPWPLRGAVVLVVLGVNVPLAMAWARRHGGGPLATSAVSAAMVWMGILFLTVCVLGAVDLVRALAGAAQAVWRPPTPMADERRLFFARLAGGAAQVAVASAAVLAVYTARRRLQVRPQAIALANWPADLDGLKVVQISDLHLATMLGVDYVAEVVRRCNALAADLVVLTGDMVDGEVATLWPQARLLAGLQAPHGVFLVTGNHEYYSGVGPWLEAFAKLGIRVLRNERVTVSGPAGGAFDLAGVDDLAGRGMAPGHGPNLAAALAGRVPGRPVVLLAHQPRFVHEAARMGVDLMLSGHTHGGQIWPFGALVRLVQPYLAGWAQHGPTQIYVNRGTGYWGPPMRLGPRPELTLFTFHRTQDRSQPA